MDVACLCLVGVVKGRDLFKVRWGCAGRMCV
jgi:hypothetical protein